MTGNDATDWRPAASLDAARRRAALIDRARAYFKAHDILEVDTPALSRAAISDPNIESIRAALATDPDNAYFLHTSPEYPMKRLLCAGWPDIGQICRVFRDGEVGRRHQPEFTMAEWYRLGITLHDMMRHTVDFITHILDATRLPPATYLAYTDAFLQRLDLHPLDAPIGDLAAAAGADARLRDSLGDDRDAWLDLLLSERIGPGFAATGLTVLHHYPATQAALARLCPDDARYADRFEVFHGGLELANGYFELSDAAEQARRFEADDAARIRRGLRRRPRDRRLLAALQAGLPPCCGVAVGLDRILMLNEGTDEMRDILTFTSMESIT